ncbi:MAG: hypothetical protein ACRCTL_06615 [Pseudomonas sp.]
MRVRRAHLDTVLIVFFMLVAAFFVLSTVYGGVLNRTFVPVGDSWKGAVGFYIDSKSDIGAWWRQYNDHRILLAKSIFWMDMEWMGSRALVYLPLHLSLLFALACTYFCYYRAVASPVVQGKRNLLVAGALCLVLAFSWMQRENIVWEFQSEFILVYLLPLVALFLYAKSVAEARGALFVLSMVLAWLSAYAMANGILALPLLAVAALLFRDSKGRIALILALSVLSLIVFFIGYEKTPGSTSGYMMLADYPLKVITYALIYLGNPIYTATHSVLLTSVLTVLALIYLAWAWVDAFRSRQNPYVSALLVYALYVCLAAALTAFGRSFMPLDLAASSRYTTPGLTFWMVVALVLLSRAPYSFRFHSGLLRWMFTVFFLLLLNAQLSSFYYVDSRLRTPFYIEVAALALQLEVDDKKAKKYLLPLSKDKDAVFDRARQAHVGIFTDEHMRFAKLMGGKTPSDWTLCATNIQSSDVVDKVKQAYRLTGVVLAEGEYQRMVFSNARGDVIGLALLGSPNLREKTPAWPELDWFLSVRNPKGFAGYALGGEISRAYCK